MQTEHVNLVLSTRLLFGWVNRISLGGRRIISTHTFSQLAAHVHVTPVLSLLCERVTYTVHLTICVFSCTIFRATRWLCIFTGHVYAVPDNLVTLDTLARSRLPPNTSFNPSRDAVQLYSNEVVMYAGEEVGVGGDGQAINLVGPRISDYEPTDSGFTEEYSDLNSSDRYRVTY